MSSRFLAAGLVALLLTSSALANVPPFPQPPAVVQSAEAKLVVQVDARATKPVLKVPVALMGPKNPGPRPGDQTLLDNPSVLVVGVALTLAFVSGGFWVLRGRQGRTAAAILCIGCLTLAGGSLFADLIRPPVQPVAPLPAVLLPAKVGLSPNVTIQFYRHPADQNVYLIVPAEKGKEPTTSSPAQPQPKPE